MTSEEKFMALAPMIKTAEGKIAYLRIGKGLMSNKVWCDYVDEDFKRVYLFDKFYPTMEIAIDNLYHKVCEE